MSHLFLFIISNFIQNFVLQELLEEILGPSSVLWSSLSATEHDFSIDVEAVQCLGSICTKWVNINPSTFPHMIPVQLLFVKGLCTSWASEIPFCSSLPNAGKYQQIHYTASEDILYYFEVCRSKWNQSFHAINFCKEKQ